MNAAINRTALRTVFYPIDPSQEMGSVHGVPAYYCCHDPPKTVMTRAIVKITKTIQIVKSTNHVSIQLAYIFLLKRKY